MHSITIGLSRDDGQGRAGEMSSKFGEVIMNSQYLYYNPLSFAQAHSLLSLNCLLGITNFSRLNGDACLSIGAMNVGEFTFLLRPSHLSREEFA